MKKALTNYKQKKAEAKAQKKEASTRNIKVKTQPFRAAVLLHGCGSKDGTEVIEASSLLIALSLHQAEVQCFAPDRMQTNVIDNNTGERN